VPFLAIAAGNFLYLAASDLIPGLHESHQKGSESTKVQFSLILLGVLLIYILSVFIG
jgi:zinc transporter ZupT